MRTLIYAMQCSGASLYAYWLGQQNPKALCIVDLWWDQLAPSPEDLEHAGDVILKCVATTKYDLWDHVSSFEPDEVLNFITDPLAVVQRLKKKSYANEGGTVAQKIRAHRSSDFGKFVGVEPREITMAKHELINRNRQLSWWAAENYQKKWGLGGIHFDEKGVPINVGNS